MKKKNSFLRERYLIILLGILAILLCAAPSGWAVTFDDGLEHDYEISDDFVQVDNATLNLLPGAHIAWYLAANAGSTVNIHGGTFSNMMPFLDVAVALGAEVTVYGTDFKIDGEPVSNGKICINYGTLTGSYENGELFSLKIDCFFEIGGDYATITLAAPGSSDPTPIDIDIKPGGNPNNINLKSRGVVPVAVLTTNDFDASNVDPNPESVTFAGAKPVRCKLCDVDGDGDVDMLFHFKTQKLVKSDNNLDGLDENSKKATLTAKLIGTMTSATTTETTDGEVIQGSDEVCIKPQKKKK